MNVTRNLTKIPGTAPHLAVSLAVSSVVGGGGFSLRGIRILFEEWLITTMRYPARLRSRGRYHSIPPGPADASWTTEGHVTAIDE